MPVEQVRQLPQAVRACHQRGYRAFAAGRRQEAVDCFRQAVTAEPTCISARQALAQVQLLLGDASGFAEHAIVMSAIDPHPMTWRGQRLGGETVLLKTAAAGFGDVVQYIRYAKLVAARGARVLVQCPPGMEQILAPVQGVTEVFSSNRWRLPLQYYRLQLLAAPFVFGTTMDNIPADTPYLKGDPTPWADFLQTLPGLKVGIAWAGKRGDSAGYEYLDDHRSMKLADMAPLFSVPGCSFVSLQLGPPSAELAKRPSGVVHDVSARLKDWTDTANLISGLDLVIVPDTALCHVAGALGKPVWLLNKYYSCWRWLLNRSDSPWYPSMRIFRQSEPYVWRPVISDVARELRYLAHAFPSPDIINEGAIQ